jgi:hypothetical protein
MYNLQVFVLIITGLDTNKPNVHLTTSKPNKKISVLWNHNHPLAEILLSVYPVQGLSAKNPTFWSCNEMCSPIKDTNPKPRDTKSLFSGKGFVRLRGFKET